MLKRKTRSNKFWIGLIYDVKRLFNELGIEKLKISFLYFSSKKMPPFWTAYPVLPFAFAHFLKRKAHFPIYFPDDAYTYAYFAEFLLRAWMPIRH